MNDANHISVDHAETVKLKIYVYNRPNELKSAIPSTLSKEYLATVYFAIINVCMYLLITYTDLISWFCSSNL